jgi:murein DD-endopeptidase MepM/ murein hydrolase activator NlpD
LAACAPSPLPEGTYRLVEPWTAVLTSSGEFLPPATGTTVPTATLPSPYNLLPRTSRPPAALATPTPDAPRPVPTIRADAVWHLVQPGDTLNSIAWTYGVSASRIARENGIANRNVLPAWSYLLIPPQSEEPRGPSFKILPDSELVYGPSSALFDLEGTVTARDGYLSMYHETVEGTWRSGTEIVRLVAQRYSVSPKLLLALLEHQSGWLTVRSPAKDTLEFPLRYVATGKDGLFSQLSWAADQLNDGFYRWRAGWSGPILIGDGQVVMPGEGINAGTAGVQTLLASLYDGDDWLVQVGEAGLFRTYLDLFGDPFALAIEPAIPEELDQPPMQLPIERDTYWSFTGGPHGAWGSGAAWAALDFAPPGNALGCVESEAWVVASADGTIVRAGEGEVVQDLDGDGLEQTGWVLLYMHVEERDRVPVGQVVRAGDRIGHPSCEGGVSDGTHVHLARKYNGEWIAADGGLPFELDGWLSSGTGVEYDGAMTRGSEKLTACSCRNDENQIYR